MCLGVDVRFCSCDCEDGEIDCVAVDSTLRCFRSTDGKSELCCKPIVFQSRIDVCNVEYCLIYSSAVSIRPVNFCLCALQTADSMSVRCSAGFCFHNV